jgi:prophage antirepressor-like protein
MNMNLQTLNFENNNVRMIMDEAGNPWWVASDVCHILEIENSRRAASRLEEFERGRTTVNTLGGRQSVTIVNESGLYALILTSRKPSAKKFRYWITHEVLPSIRKTGSYSRQSPYRLPETYTEALHDLWQKSKECDALLEERKTLLPKAQFYDAYRAGKGGHGLQVTGKILKKQPNLFIKTLVNDGCLHYRDRRLVPNVRYEKAGWFKVRVAIDQGANIRHQTVVTPYGLQQLSILYGFIDEGDNLPDLT